MRICVISTVSYWHGLRGGMDLHGKHLLEGLASKGHEVIVISTKHPSGKEYENINGIRLYYLQNTTFGSPRKKWEEESIKRFKAISGRGKIDVILSQSRAAYGVAKIAKDMGIPVVTIMHGYQTMILRSIWNQVRNFRKGYLTFFKASLATFYYSVFQEYPLLMNSSAIIAVSDNVGEVLGRKPFIDRNKISVINYGIDLGIFNVSQEKRKKTREYLNISDQDRVILFLSLLSKQKGADVALRSFKELSEKETNIKLIIGGDGEYLGEAKRLAKALHIEQAVSFPGFVPNEETSGYYNAADVFVFPTLRLESFGIVIAEAMACGKPVIASNIGSIPNVIDNGLNGILIPPGDYRELTQQIRRLLKDQDYFNMLSQNAHLKATSNFGLDRMVEKTISVLELVRKDCTTVSDL
jgi:glycosyltransferase involved in cell wall biosynthesis